MAKELPYFKFDTSAWSSGKIQICSRESKGLFIDLSSLYWSRLGDLSFKLAVQMLCNGNANAFSELLDEKLVQVDEKGEINLKFLDSQLREFKKVSKARSQSARARWGNANAMQTHSKCNAIREEKIREDKIESARTKDFTDPEPENETETVHVPGRERKNGFLNPQMANVVEYTPIGRNSKEVYEWLSAKITNDEQWWLGLKKYCKVLTMTRDDVETSVKMWASHVVEKDKAVLRNESIAIESLKKWLLRQSAFKK